MVSKVSRFDVADYLTDDNMIAEYLSSVIYEEDTSLLIAAIGDIAKARGIDHIAALSGLGRENVYKALSPGSKPRFDTIMKVLKALGGYPYSFHLQGTKLLQLNKQHKFNNNIKVCVLHKPPFPNPNEFENKGLWEKVKKGRK